MLLQSNNVLMALLAGDAIKDVKGINDQEVIEKVNAFLVTTPEGFWVCNVCRYGSRSKENVMEHAESHIGGISYTCQHCSREFVKKLSLNSHLPKCPTGKKKKIQE